MARRHLRELLSEEQEPFVLKSYIDERRCQLRRPIPKTHSQARKRPPSSESQAFPTNISKSPLFNPFQDTCFVNNSPLFDLTAKNPSAASRTAAHLLLHCALRIQGAKQQKRNKSRGSSLKGHGLRFFSTVLKRLAQKKRSCETRAEDIKVSVKDISRWDSLHTADCRRTQKTAQHDEEKRFPEMDHSEHSNRSGGMERSKMKAKVSGHTKETGSPGKTQVDSGPNEEEFSSRSSPVRPAKLQPELASPAGTPPRHQKTGRQLLGGTGNDGGVKAEKEGLDEEQEREQLSPVSVLDPPFHEGKEDHLDGHVDSCHQSLVLVQRATQQVMREIRRLDNLAQLDPIELDKLLAEEPEDDGDEYDSDDGDGDIHGYGSNEPIDDDLGYDGRTGEKLKAHSTDLNREEIHELIRGILVQSNGLGPRTEKIPMDMKSLVSDIVEEEREGTTTMLDAEALVERVHRRFEAWKEVSSNTIDMMVDLDFRQEGERWNKCGKAVQDFVVPVESAIFEILLLARRGMDGKRWKLNFGADGGRYV